MINEFRGKTWISWAQFIALGALSLFALPLGIGFWTGAILDAQDHPAPEAGRPLVIIGSVMGVVALMSLVRIIHLRKPVLRICREGLELRIVGGFGIFGMPLLVMMPVIGHALGLIELVVSLVTWRGMKAMALRYPWRDLASVRVEGMPMHEFLVIEGTWEGERSMSEIRLVNAYFDTPLKQIDASIRQAMHMHRPDMLPSWDSAA